MHPIASDKDLLGTAARCLGVEAELLLLQRYYGSREDARYELAQLDRTGRLQASFARLLRLELGMPGTPVVGRRSVGLNGRVYV
jgi:hypothetical protein